MTVTRAEALFERVNRTEDTATFMSVVDEGEPRAVVIIPADLDDELNGPAFITVTIRPGDHLNPPQTEYQVGGVRVDKAEEGAEEGRRG